MAPLPDVYCWIKLIGQSSGKVIPSGSTVGLNPGPDSVIVRYVVANDSNKPTGNITVVGSLKKNGGSLPKPVPVTTIQLQPKQLWRHEHTVKVGDVGMYEAHLLGEVGNVLNEEDEKNNVAKASFQIIKPPA